MKTAEHRGVAASRVVLEAVDIRKSFGGIRALKGISLKLLAGETHALVGENGAGKSTLIKIFTGALQPDAGEIRVHGKIVEHHSPAHARALGIAAIYQQPALFPDLTVAENIGLRLERGGPWRLLKWGEGRRAGAGGVAKGGGAAAAGGGVARAVGGDDFAGCVCAGVVDAAAAVGGDR